MSLAIYKPFAKLLFAGLGVFGMPLDVHRERPKFEAPIQRVGVVSVRAPISYLSFDGKKVLMVPEFDLFIDLPMDLKGVHISRNYEAMVEVVELLDGKTFKLEDACGLMARELLKRHEYASRSEVRAKGEVITPKRAPVTKAKGYETFDVFASAVARRDGSIRRSIGVGVVGLTACPCAQELLKEGVTLPDDFPFGTHVQRAYGVLMTELPEGYELDVKKLYDIVERSFSSPTYGTLKRADEKEVVERALKNPKFAEDCVRSMMDGFVKSFPDLGDDVVVRFYVRSEESIHEHDLVAESVCELGRLRSMRNGGQG